MFTSFSTALSALSAHAVAVDVVSNNLANLNTTGFKASSVAFHDLVSQSMGVRPGETQVGFGVGRPVTVQHFRQGAIQASDGPLDCAIRGDGFFVVRNSAGETLYTRAGNLRVDRDGTLMTTAGQRVQGWTASDGGVNASGVVGDIVVPVGSIKPPQASSSFSLDLNLNAAAQEGDSFSTSIEVFDSLGVPHLLTAQLTRGEAANEWNYSISIPEDDVTGEAAPVTGTLSFDSLGKLIAPEADGDAPSLAVTGLTSGAEDMQISWQLYDGTAARITQYGQPSAVSANAQDGAPAAQLLRVSLADGGMVMAEFSNGQQVVAGQVALAGIRNPESLVAVGGNCFQLGHGSAAPAIGQAGTGGRGDILGGATEFSTVDIAREFTQLIVLQRGYQANARVVTAADELSQETINLKR